MEDVAAKMQRAGERHAGAREGKVVDWALHAWEAFGVGAVHEFLCPPAQSTSGTFTSTCSCPTDHPAAAEGRERGAPTNTRLHSPSRDGWCRSPPEEAQFKTSLTNINHGQVPTDHPAPRRAPTIPRFRPLPRRRQFSRGKDASCVGEMISGRAPPISPVAFAKSMRERVATGDRLHGECGPGPRRYEKGFVGVINAVAAGIDSRGLSYANLGWGDEEATTLLEALQYAAEHCAFPYGPIKIYIDGNEISAPSLRNCLRTSSRGRTSSRVRLA